MCKIFFDVWSGKEFERNVITQTECTQLLFSGSGSGIKEPLVVFGSQIFTCKITL